MYPPFLRSVLAFFNLTVFNTDILRDWPPAMKSALCTAPLASIQKALHNSTADFYILLFLPRLPGTGSSLDFNGN